MRSHFHIFTYVIKLKRTENKIAC